MSETKFTKGEWVAFYPHELLNSGHVSVENEDGRQICISEVHKSDLTEKTANMRLIANSPKMYAMLEMISDIYAEYYLRNEIDQLLAEIRGE